MDVASTLGQSGVTSTISGPGIFPTTLVCSPHRERSKGEKREKREDAQGRCLATLKDSRKKENFVMTGFLTFLSLRVEVNYPELRGMLSPQGVDPSVPRTSQD